MIGWKLTHGWKVLYGFQKFNCFFPLLNVIAGRITAKIWRPGLKKVLVHVMGVHCKIFLRNGQVGASPFNFPIKGDCVMAKVYDMSILFLDLDMANLQIMSRLNFKGFSTIFSASGSDNFGLSLKMDGMEGWVRLITQLLERKSTPFRNIHNDLQLF